MKSQARWLDLMTASLLLVVVVVPIAYLPSWIAYPIGEALGRLAYLVDRAGDAGLKGSRAQGLESVVIVDSSEGR